MKNWIIGAFLVLAVAAAYYYFAIYQQAGPEVVIKAPEAAEEAVTVPEEPTKQPGLTTTSETGLPPVTPPETEQIPLPMLTESDGVALETLGNLVSESDTARFFVSENVIPRMVATVDLLGSRKIPGAVQAVHGPETPFVAVANDQPETIVRNEEGDEIPQFYIDPSNYERYTPYVEMLEGAETAQLVESYRSHYPLFQEAYRQMGYSEGDFNVRLAEMIEELLSTPDVSGPLELVKPEAFYLFADPRLESLSAGQKILLRMGSENRARVKSKLMEIRDAL
ncbi:MAG: DUF3014 domain-containing protein [Xanthomonadales bacterium]|nr:DUF3014 domain-containing protein [Gammaproteobacteria bacterium]NNK52760.1 DUF3014 domain-containing protein [Xanthomonadales bacterium]